MEKDSLTHYRKAFNRLQSLSHYSKSVEEYFKEMKIAMIRAHVFEDKEATMTKF